jgi:enterochelin esterase-like enzyme
VDLPVSTPTLAVTASAVPSATPTLTATATATAAPCREAAGRTRSFEVTSADLKKPLAYRVYFPPCYDPSGETRYPVLYMLHGQTYNDDQWSRLGIAEAAAALVLKEKARPFLIVMPYEIDPFGDPYAPGFGSALADTLIPKIDLTYPTCPERACRAVGGLSRGGAWAFLLALEHPGLFGQAAGHSMVPFNGMKQRLTRQIKAADGQDLPRLSIDMGKNDQYLPVLSEYEKLLTQLGVDHTFTLNPGNHEEKYWSAHVKEYLRWYAAGFPGK